MSPYNKGKIERMKLHKRYLYSCYYRSSILSCFVFTLNGKIDNHSERKKYQKNRSRMHRREEYIAAGIYPFRKKALPLLSSSSLVRAISPSICRVIDATGCNKLQLLIWHKVQLSLYIIMAQRNILRYKKGIVNESNIDILSKNQSQCIDFRVIVFVSLHWY